MARPKLLTIQQAAQRIGTCDDVIRDMIRLGKFPGAFDASVGGKRKHYRIPTAEVSALIAARLRDRPTVEAR